MSEKSKHFLSKFRYYSEIWHNFFELIGASDILHLFFRFFSYRGRLKHNKPAASWTYFNFCIFESFSKFRKSNQLFGVEPLNYVPEQVTFEVPNWIRENFRNKFSIRSHWCSGLKIASDGNNSTRFLRKGIFCWEHSALPFRSLPVFCPGWGSFLHSATESFYYRFFLLIGNCHRWCWILGSSFNSVHNFFRFTFAGVAFVIMGTFCFVDSFVFSFQDCGTF